MDHETVVAYLNRVGLAAPVAGDAEGLRTLHRAHQLTVPFENLSIHLGEPVSLDEPDLIDKMVRRTQFRRAFPRKRFVKPFTSRRRGNASTPTFLPLARSAVCESVEILVVWAYAPSS